MVYNFDSLTGGSYGSLNYINGGILNDGDQAIGIDDDGNARKFRLNASSGMAQSLPWIVKPLADFGDKRWVNVPDVSSIAPYDRQMLANEEIPYLAPIMICYIDANGYDILNPSPDFPDGSLICIMNVGSSSFAFDANSPGLNAGVGGGQQAFFLKVGGYWS